MSFIWLYHNRLLSILFNSLFEGFRIEINFPRYFSPVFCCVTLGFGSFKHSSLQFLLTVELCIESAGVSRFRNQGDIKPSGSASLSQKFFNNNQGI